MPTAQATSNKATVRRMLDAANTHDEETMSSTLDEIFRPDVVIRTALPIDAEGVAAIKFVFDTLHRAFPDLHITIDDLIAEDDKVVTCNTVTGTNLGEYMGQPPTGRPVTYKEIFIIRFADGKIVETWGVADVLSQMRQLGRIPA